MLKITTTRAGPTVFVVKTYFALICKAPRAPMFLFLPGYRYLVVFVY